MPTDYQKNGNAPDKVQILGVAVGLLGLLDNACQFILR
jgi:hypothetical protein